MHAVILHNPRCSTSRTTLALIRQAGIEPEVVDYLAHPPSQEQLAELIRATGLPVREVLRSKEAKYAELGLDDPAHGDGALLAAMVREPILINRPIVQTALGTRLCRPAGTVLEILPQ
jgi:arsenate reductase